LAKRSYEVNMTEGPLWGKILFYMIPLMLTNVLQLLYNAADNIIVGRFAADGEAALAAVSSTGSLINLIVNLFIGLSVGTTVAVANYRGAGKYRDVQETVHTSIAISFLGGFVLLIAGIILAKPLLRLMDSPENVIDLAAEYLVIYFAGMPFNMAFNFGAAVLRAVGDTKRPLYILTFSGAMNVLMNLLFVTVFHIDVAGVALATVLSQVISAVMVLYCLMRSDGDIHLDVKQLKIHPSRLIELTKYGLPAGLQGTLFSLSNVVIQSTINSYGSAVMAGNGIASNAEGFIAAFNNSVYQACLTFTGQNCGAKKYKRLNTVLGICIVYMLVMACALGQLMIHFGDAVLALYRPDRDPAVFEAGMIRITIMCSAYCLCGMMDTLCGALRGMGKTLIPMVVSLLGACVFRLIWIATYYAAHPSLQVLYYSYPISWSMVSIVYFIMIFVVRRKLKRDEPEKFV